LPNVSSLSLPGLRDQLMQSSSGLNVLLTSNEISYLADAGTVAAGPGSSACVHRMVLSHPHFVWTLATRQTVRAILEQHTQEAGLSFDLSAAASQPAGPAGQGV
jgi:hypothetical protein